MLQTFEMQAIIFYRYLSEKFIFYFVDSFVYFDHWIYAMLQTIINHLNAIIIRDVQIYVFFSMSMSLAGCPVKLPPIKHQL